MKHSILRRYQQTRTRQFTLLKAALSDREHNATRALPSFLDADIGATEVCTVTADGVEFQALVTVYAITDATAHFHTVIEP